MIILIQQNHIHVCIFINEYDVKWLTNFTNIYSSRQLSIAYIRHEVWTVAQTSEERTLSLYCRTDSEKYLRWMGTLEKKPTEELISNLFCGTDSR